MKKYIKILSAVMIGCLLGSVAIVFANQAIQAMQNTEIKISLNGDVQEFIDETTGETQYPITYNNRTYLPLRNVANLAGLYVDYDSATNTVILSKDGYVEEVEITPEENESSYEVIQGGTEEELPVDSSFSGRIRPYESYLENNLNSTDGSVFVSKGQLKKNDNGYILTLTMNGAQTFSEEELKSVMSKLNGNVASTKYKGYTFYNSVDLLKSNLNNETYFEMVDNLLENGGYLTTGEDRSLYCFSKNEENGLYIVKGIPAAGSSEFVVSEPKKDIDITLNGNDKIRFLINGNEDENNKIEMTVSEYYDKVIMNEEPSINLSKNLSVTKDQIGSSQGYYAENVNAYSFQNDYILVNVKSGGV